MAFVIPEDLAVFSTEGLSDLRRVAAAERDELRASTTADAITDEQLDRLETLVAFIGTADEEITGRQARQARFDATAPPPAPEPAPAPEPEPEPVTASGDPEPAPDSGQDEPPAQPAPATRVDVAALAAGSDGTTGTADALSPSAFGDHVIVAAADIPGVTTGAELDSWDAVATAFVNRTRAYSGRTPTRHAVAEIQRRFGTEFTITQAESRDKVAANNKLQHVMNEARLPGGSLLAANGWCSPSENLYTTCNQIGTDGMWSGPEVSAPRGGINHNQGIEFDAVFGDGSGFTIMTEDDVISGEVKTCREVPCPPFVDDRLKISALCLTGSILQNRTYPEFVSEFIQGFMAVGAHNLNRQIIADVVAGSTAVDLTAAAPWNSDSSVVSQTLSAVAHAIVDIKYRLRLPQSSTLEVVLPFWVIEQYRADYIRRNGVSDPNLADAQLAAWFATRSARAQYVYDWQDAFSDSGVGYGADDALTTVPTSVDFLVYPAGTWVLARLDVIRLDSVYDSVNLPQNLVTQLFMEDGFRAMRMCPLSRVYTVPICPTGHTSELQTVSCGS
jgi:hypothetical protein